MTLTQGELGWYVHVHESICGPFSRRYEALEFYTIWRFKGWLAAMNFRIRTAQRQVTT